MSISGVGNFSPEAIQKVGQEALDNVSTGIDAASKGGEKIKDSLNAFQQLPPIEAGGFETAEPGGIQAPAEYLNEAIKMGAAGEDLGLYINDPQFDLNGGLELASENLKLTPEIADAVLGEAKVPNLKLTPELVEAVQVDQTPELVLNPEIIATVAESTTQASSSGKSAEQGLMDAYESQQDKLTALTEEIATLDTSTPEGQKRFFEIQQEFSQVMTMMSVIEGMLNKISEMKDRIAQNF